MAAIMGIDLGGTKVRFGIVSENGVIIDLREAYTSHDNGIYGLKEQIFLTGKDLISKYSVKAAGICLPGVVSENGGLQYATNLLLGDTVNHLVQDIQQEFNIPVFAENDGNAAAYGEYVYGCKRNVESMYYITISTGIGGGYIWNGNIMKGYNGFAGEVGGILVEDTKEEFRGLTPGTVEGCASGSALMIKGRKIKEELPDASEVFYMAERGDIYAKELIERMTTGLSRMFAAISMVIDPQIFVLGGGCMKSDKFFLNQVIEKYQAIVPEGLRKTKFQKAVLEEPGIMGCIEIVKENMKNG